ncbi:MAG: BREX system ATP-binding domain-containing protein [Oceanobacter sp.]
MTDNAFVGRQRELAILEKALNHAQQGHTQFVFLRGDGGSGKTTLIDQFCRQCEPLVISAHGMSLPFLECGEAYFPFLDLLSKLAAIKPPGDEKEPGFSDYSKAFVKALVDNGEDLVGTLLPSGSGVVKMVKSANKLWGDTKKQVSGDASIASSASIDTNKIHMQYARVLQSIAKKYPLVLCLDSFHWADMASLDMLIYLASNIKNSRILFVLALNDYEVPRSTDGNLMNSVYRLCTSSNHH